MSHRYSFRPRKVVVTYSEDKEDRIISTDGGKAGRDEEERQGAHLVCEEESDCEGSEGELEDDEVDPESEEAASDVTGSSEEPPPEDDIPSSDNSIHEFIDDNSESEGIDPDGEYQDVEDSDDGYDDDDDEDEDWDDEEDEGYYSEDPIRIDDGDEESDANEQGEADEDRVAVESPDDAERIYARVDQEKNGNASEDGGDSDNVMDMEAVDEMDEGFYGDVSPIETQPLLGPPLPHRAADRRHRSKAGYIMALGLYRSSRFADGVPVIGQPR